MSKELFAVVIILDDCYAILVCCYWLSIRDFLIRALLRSSMRNLDENLSETHLLIEWLIFTVSVVAILLVLYLLGKHFENTIIYNKL